MESSTAGGDDRVLKSEKLSPPRTAEGLVELFKRLIALPYTQSILVQPSSVTVERMVMAGEDVVPKAVNSGPPDVGFLLATLEKKGALHELEFRVDRHPHMALFEATQMISGKDLRPQHLVAPDASWLSAFLGLDEGQAPSSVYGMTVHYVGEELMDERILVVGGTSPFFSDSEIGIAIPLVV